jgi:hypothetical protein
MLKSRNSLCNPINFVTGLSARLSYQCTDVLLTTNQRQHLFCVSQYEQSTDQYPSTGRTATLCRIVVCTSVNTTWCTVGLIQNVMEHAEPTPTFFYFLPILRQSRIIRCNRQAALHSALFNYISFVIGGNDKNKQLTIIKTMYTGINCNK